MLALTSMCFAGYWHCAHCDRVVHIAGDPDSPTRCPHCKKPTAMWVKPIFDDYEKVTTGHQLVAGAIAPHERREAAPRQATPVEIYRHRLLSVQNLLRKMGGWSHR